MRCLTLREIQQAELSILTEFDHACKKEGLRYSLVGGTLLGAVRHKGFIPWDDDIDVAMPRPDYEQLREMAPQLFAFTQCKMVGYPTEETEQPVFSKLIDSSIVVKDVFRDELTNLWIDIFPIDGLPSNDEEIRRIYKRARQLRRLTLTSHADLSAGKTMLRRIVKNVFHPFDKAFSIGKRCEASLNKLAKSHSFENAEYVGSVVWGLYEMREKMPADAYSKFIDIEFEGKVFPAIACWEHYLTSLYGDYLKLPPESERVAHEMVVWRLDEEMKEVK